MQFLAGRKMVFVRHEMTEPPYAEMAPTSETYLRSIPGFGSPASAEVWSFARHLECVPSQEWDAIAEFAFDAVWLMGVWERSPAGIAIANRNAGLLEDFRRALPDFQLPDNVGSPYCVRRYEVDAATGRTPWS